MNPIKIDNYRSTGLVALLFVTIVLITGVGRWLPEWSILFLAPLLFIAIAWLATKLTHPSGRVLDAKEIGLVLRDYPELNSWVESLLDKNELVTLGRVRRVISENAAEEAEKQRIAEANSLLEEQRKAVINSSRIASRQS